MKKGLFTFFAVAVVSGVSSRAAASPLFELAGATTGNGGFNARTVSSGSANAYFNPALLTDAESGFDLGVFFMSDQIGVRLEARPSADADIPLGSENAARPDGSRYDRYGLPTEWLESGKAADPPDTPLRPRPRQGAGSGHNLRAYQVIGFVQKLFEGRLAAGLYAMVPYSKFTGAAAFYSDEREQYFSNSLHPELYADRLTATSLAFGAGFKVNDKISIGAAATLSLRTVAATPTYVADVGRFQDILVDSNVNVNAAVSPHFGAAFKPAKGWQVTATVHTPQKFEIGTDFTFLLANGLEQGAGLRFTHAYLPWTFAVGTAYDGIKLGNESSLGFAATITHERWSDYVDRHGGEPSGAYGWYDTFTGVVGTRVTAGDSRAYLDMTYRPTPVPDQTGRTNYVDNNRLGMSTGVEHKWRLLGGTFKAGISFQAHRLLTRETHKTPTPTSPDGKNNTPNLVTDEMPDDAVLQGEPLKAAKGLQTNNPGWPGYSSEGWILGGGVNLAFTM
jgi:long-chain fatty acid transport protein